MAKSPERKYGYRASPQLSASQMAEYTASATSPTRRKSIIQAARFPKTSVVARYDYARNGLIKFLADDTRSIRHLADTVTVLEDRERRPGVTDWVKQDARYSKEAVEAFQKAYNRLGLRTLDCFTPEGRLPKLDKWPTKISVDLDVLIRKPVKGEETHLGGAILLFSRGEKSTKARVDQCRTIAGLIYVYCDHWLNKIGVADPALCLAIDVFAGLAYRPQGTFARKARNVEDACEEIAGRWRLIGPPEDYDGPPYK